MKPKLEIVASNDPPPPTSAEGVPQQMEMPFAIVNGEPVTELPKDLYIPPQALEVILEAFEGPLDLLLYLIRRQNLDILDIPIAEITRQYMQYIELMQELHLELAGEYMVMAATLAEIKSRMLLPRPKTDGQAEEEDPRAELVRRLQEYERFKRAAEDLDRLPRLERDTWCAGAELKDRKVVRLLPQVTLKEMLLAFKEVVIRAEMFSHHHVARERLSVRQRMTDILATLERASFVEFVRLFRPEEGRMGVTVTFIAILELMREGLLDIVQSEPFAPLHVRLAPENRKLRLVANNERPDAPPGEGAAVLAESVYEQADEAEATAETDAGDSGAALADVDTADASGGSDDFDDADTADVSEMDVIGPADVEAEASTDDAAGTEAADPSSTDGMQDATIAEHADSTATGELAPFAPEDAAPEPEHAAHDEARPLTATADIDHAHPDAEAAGGDVDSEGGESPPSDKGRS
jgi:segregation and condensation protein A